MLKYVIDKLLAPLIEEEWREEALATIYELHEYSLQRKINPFIASIFTIVQTLSIIVYMPAFKIDGKKLLRKVRRTGERMLSSFLVYFIRFVWMVPVTPFLVASYTIRLFLPDRQTQTNLAYRRELQSKEKNLNRSLRTLETDYLTKACARQARMNLRKKLVRRHKD